MYTIFQIRISKLRISLHNFKDIGRRVGVSKSKMAYTNDKEIMWHFRLGYLELRFTFQY